MVKMLTVREVAELCGLCETTVRHWIREGKIEAVDLTPDAGQRCYRIPADALRELGIPTESTK